MRFDVYLIAHGKLDTAKSRAAVLQLAIANQVLQSPRLQSMHVFAWESMASQEFMIMIPRLHTAARWLQQRRRRNCSQSFWVNDKAVTRTHQFDIGWKKFNRSKNSKKLLELSYIERFAWSNVANEANLGSSQKRRIKKSSQSVALKNIVVPKIPRLHAVARWLQQRRRRHCSQSLWTNDKFDIEWKKSTRSKNSKKPFELSNLRYPRKKRSKKVRRVWPSKICM